TATAPQDYATVSGTLSWDAGDAAIKLFTVPLVVDGVVDNDTTRFESVILRLFNPQVGTVASPNLLGSRTNATLLIEDADAYGTLAFNQSFYQADENGGSATISVIRRDGLAGNVSVQFTTTPTDPTSPGLDYVPTSGTLAFLPG